MTASLNGGTPNSAVTLLPKPSSPVWFVARTLLYRAWRTGVWFWGIALTVVVLGTAVASMFTTVDWSFVGFGRQATVWFLFPQAILQVSLNLRVQIAAGVSRRNFWRGTVLGEVLVGAANAVVFVGVLQMERAVHAVMGWPFEVRDGLDTSGSHIGVLLADFGSTFVTAGVVGLLVGAVYQRLNPWWATLSLPVVVGPLVALIGLIAFGFDEQSGLTVLSQFSAPLATEVGIIASYAAVVTLVFALIIRSVPVRSPVV